jgi:hypothetical protein
LFESLPLLDTTELIQLVKLTLLRLTRKQNLGMCVGRTSFSTDDSKIAEEGIEMTQRSKGCIFAGDFQRFKRISTKVDFESVILRPCE